MLTGKHDRVFNFIRGYIESSGESPTMMEIASYFGYRSPATVHKILGKLIAQGLLTKTPNVARGLALKETQ